MSNSKRKSDYELLRETIKQKDKQKARNLITSNIIVNIRKSRGNTPLHWAIIKFDDLEIMTMLLDRGANIHAKNHRRQKPLQIAIENNKVEAAQLLIRRGALIGEDLNALLFKVIEQKKPKIIKILIEHELQNNPSIDLKIFFKAAIFHEQSSVIESILSHFHQSLKPSDKYIPKEVVIKSGLEYEKCIELFLKWNFTVNPDSKYDEDFVYEAVKNGHLPIVLQLLKMGIDVNLVNLKTGLNLLKVACIHKHHEIVENLLKYNACVNTTTPTNIEILNNFLHNSCNHLFLSVLNTNNLRDITCLHIAVLNSDPLMIKLLLKYGATIIDDPKLLFITSIAVKSNNEEIVRIFLDHGVDVNETDPEGKSLLHFCVLPDDDEEDLRYEIAKLLLKRGANIHFKIPGNSLIYEAITNRHCKIAQLFLDDNADIQYINPEGNTPLHAAIGNDFNIEFIKALLKRNLPVNAANNDMITPLHVACLMKLTNQLEIIQTLIDYNANINCTDDELMTPLHFACRSQNFDVVAILLEKGANTNAKNNEDQTPLHLACELEYFVSLSSPFKNDTSMTASIIELLLQHDANIEAVDDKGWTPLFEACYSGNDTAVQCLLDNHANVNHTDLEKSTSLYIAAKNIEDNSKVIEILLKHKVNVHFIDKSGKSVIHVIVKNNATEAIKILASTKINFNPVDKKGDTPLHIAVQQQSVEMVKNLIKYGANVNVLNKKNRTALHAAIKNIFVYQAKFEILHILRLCCRSPQDSSHVDLYCNACTISINSYKEIAKILKIQVVKLKAAGLKVNKSNLKLIYDFDDSETSDDESTDEDDSDDENVKSDVLQIEIDCVQEIEKMRMENVGVNSMTFHDLLTKNTHLLSRYVKNKKIRQILELEEYDKKFPLYMDIVRNRFRDAKFRYRLMNSAKQYFTSNITQQLSDDCIDTVFSYFNVKEIKTFIRAMKPLDE